jgi:LCP family protein required for cell wall assembly/PAS domain S-box-containing protein
MVEEALINQLEDLFSGLQDPLTAQEEALVSFSLAVAHDVSRSERLEREREKMYERHMLQTHVVAEMAQEIATAPTLDELDRRAADLIKERLGYYHVKVFRYYSELLYGSNVVNTAATTGRSVLIPDVTQDPDWSPPPDLPEIEGELAVPILLRGQVMGVLHVLSDTAGALTREDEAVLLDLAGRIAGAIENTRLLRKASASYRPAGPPRGICWLTFEGNVIIYANPTLCGILGEAKPEDVIGKSITAYYPSDWRERVRDEILPVVMREGQWVGELPFRSVQGKITPTIQSIFLIRDERGKPLYLANAVTDVTQQKQVGSLSDKRIEEEKSNAPRLIKWMTDRVPLQEMWRRVSTGLFALGAMLVMGTLFTWTIRDQVQAKNPMMTATPAASLSAPLTAVAVTPSSPNPSPTMVAAALPSPTSSPATATATSPSSTRVPPAATPTPLPPSPTWTPAPTLTPSPVPLITPSPFPAPGPAGFVPSTTLAIPMPVSPVPVAADAVNIVVLGSDHRPDWSAWHTDVVQVVSIQRDGGAVSVISIPRDLYLYIPGIGMSRINFADYDGEAYGYEGGGPALVRDTLLYNLGIRVDHYVRTDFDGLIGIVDTIGGVDIPVHCRLSDHWPYPDENGEYPILTMEPGIHHMDGETALWYARSRLTTSVFSRERRQQQVLQAIWHKARDAGMLTQVPALWKQAKEMVLTDLALVDVLDLAKIALTLEDRNVRFYNINGDVVTPWTTPYGGHVFLPRWEEIQPILAEAMAPIPEARMGRTYLPVEIWNGTSNPDWDLLAADRIYRVGFPVVIGEPPRYDYDTTQLIIFGERLKGTGVGYLQQMLGLSDDQVRYQHWDSSEFGFRLILGADYQTCPQS